MGFIMSVGISSSNASASGSPSLEENFLTALSSLKVSTQRGKSSSNIQRDAVAASLQSLKERSNSRLLFEALDVSTRPKETQKPLQYLNLMDTCEKTLKQQVEKCARVFNGLQEAQDVLIASMFLTCPAIQSREVAHSFLRGENPIDVANATVLGSGSFGVVNKVSVLGSLSAAKSIKEDKPSQKEKFLAEALILQKCAHPHVIGLNLVDQESGTLYLELAQKGTMGDFSKQSEFNAKTLASILQQTALGLLHVHSQGYLHGDIKPDNILINHLNQAKIADFGSATAFEDFQPKEMKGTPFYLSPEALKGQTEKSCAAKIDTWAFGMLIWELLKNTAYSTPFVFPHLNDGVIQPQTYENPFMFIMRVGRHFNGFSSEVLEATTDPSERQRLDPTGKLFELMQRCLDFDPAKRPTMEQIVEALS
jgi:tRNA A-37 threonylcarbamoyl transferase component Bud32